MNLSSYIFSGIVMIRVGLFNDILRFGYVLCIILYFCCILFIFNCTDNFDVSLSEISILALCAVKYEQCSKFKISHATKSKISLSEQI